MDILLFLLAMYALYRKYKKKGIPKRPPKKRFAGRVQPSAAQPVFAPEQPMEEGISYAEPFRGSLEAESTEGECTCDPSLEHERIARQDPASVYAGEIGASSSPLSLTPHGLVRGVVMAEILTRRYPRER